ncbi:hypothetical protein DRE_00984 [Drechslerella stenobrocha 248]|uniref:F-box domain-containing protein n=1 Tax=Drechslerella stenobrocha 248 TaxID=1043628 RepID=W7I7H5_9PEZI|nr:hypothetical protein DRE_00984 [Drechslerella stenobrocha 248]
MLQRTLKRLTQSWNRDGPRLSAEAPEEQNPPISTPPPAPPAPPATTTGRRQYPDTIPTQTTTLCQPTNDPPRDVDTEPIVQTSAFLALPLDIVSLVLDYLDLRDRIALSLTTRGLRHLSPPVARTHTVRATKAAICVSKIYKRIMPFKYRVPLTYTRPCPYCGQPLCPPTCGSALFLDSLSGIFYPASLYKTRRARLACPRESAIHNFSTHVYLTIWCAHHRCPRDLFADTRQPPDEDIEVGSRLFVTENWRWWLVPQYYRQFYAATWLAGERHDYSHLAVSRTAASSNRKSGVVNSATGVSGTVGDDSNNTGQLAPLYERFVYVMWCMHCCRPLVMMDMTSWRLQLPFRSFCGCNEGGTAMPGCRRCGVVTVKFTAVQAFEVFSDRGDIDRSSGIHPGPKYEIPRVLFLATECKRVQDSRTSIPERVRIVPRDAAAANAALAIVRGVKVVMPPPPPRLGVPQLPYEIVKKVMEQLQADGGGFAACLPAYRASYCFLKGGANGQPVEAEELVELATAAARYEYGRGPGSGYPDADNLTPFYFLAQR